MYGWVGAILHEVEAVCMGRGYLILHGLKCMCVWGGGR